MKGMAFPRIVGLLLICSGLVAMIGWLAHIPALLQLSPQLKSVSFNAALCYLLVGLVFSLTDLTKLQNQMYLAAGVFVGALAFLTLIQVFFNLPLNIDQLFVYDWTQTDKIAPASMALNTALIHTLTGAVLIMLPYTQKKIIALTTHFFIFTILIAAFSALIGYLLNISILFEWKPNSQMTLYSAINCCLLGIGLWGIWNNHPHYQILYAGKEEKNLLLHISTFVIGLIILVTLATILYLSPESFSAYLTHETIVLTLLGIIGGFLLLYWQIFPMLRSLFYSREALLDANQLLQESENRFRSAFDYAAIGMALISPEGRCIKVNKSLCDMLGMSQMELVNMDLRQLVYPDDLQKDLHYIQKMLEGEVSSHQSEQRFFHKTGSIIWVRVSMSLIYDARGGPLYFISQLQNISAEKKAEEQLRQLAYHDPLTGLANRNKLEQYLHHLIISYRRNQPGFALIFLDLDNFKNINDTVGHDSGDLLLQVVAERLKTTVRDTDMVARMGGDEFVLVITNIKKIDTVALIAQKILHNLLKPLVIKGHEIYVTTSIGISIYPYDGEDIQTLIKNADLALYRAKEQGRNNYQFCTPEMTLKAQEKMKRQNALSHALVKDEFVLYYQPQMDLKTGRVNGVEALLRWKNKQFGMVTTEEIISLSEESGLIIALSEWILKTACLQVKKWHEAGFQDLSVSINLSPRQFKQITFVENILNLLTEIEYAPENVELEITESLIMQDPENTLKILQQFKKIGAKIAIDDFGTGYSSMSYLKRFSVDKLKIDKTFMHQIPKDEMSVSIAKAMIAMAHKLNIKTIAEGIETKEQYEFLLAEDCDEMQGYYLSRPLSANDMTKFLEESVNGIQLPDEPRREFES